MGARPLRRVITNRIEDRLSDALLAGEFKTGDTIMIDWNPESDEFTFKAVEKPPEDEPEGTLEASM